MVHIICIVCHVLRHDATIDILHFLYRFVTLGVIINSICIHCAFLGSIFYVWWENVLLADDAAGNNITFTNSIFD